MNTIPRVRRFGYTSFFDNNVKTVKDIKKAKLDFEDSYFKHMIISKKLILLIILSETAFEIIIERLLETYNEFNFEDLSNHRYPFEKIYILYNEMPDNLRDLDYRQQIEAAQNIQFFFTGNISNITNEYSENNL
jgi:hypothetical protein